MRNIIKLNNKIAFFKYDGISPISTLNNTMCYMKLEEINLNHKKISFPFYYTKDYKWFKVNSNKTILEQIYDELNSLYDKFKDCQNIIVKLNCDYKEPIIDMEIFPIIDEDSELGYKVRLLCEDMFDYSELCEFKSGTLDELILNDPFRHLFSETDMEFLKVLPFLNCGITRFVDNKVLPIEYWELYYSEHYKSSDEDNSKDFYIL